MPPERKAPKVPAWARALRGALDGASRVDFVGVGNELRGDDAAGLAIISLLRSRLRGRRVPRARIHPLASMPERLLSRLSMTAENIVIFDAVEGASPPGKILCRTLAESKYGFFATHNVPLTLVPGLASRRKEVMIVGVQPKSLEVGEGLSPEVAASVEAIVKEVAHYLGV